MEKENFSANNRESIVKDTRVKVLSLYKLDMERAGKLIEKQRDFLEQKYPDYDNYLLYYALILSSPGEGKSRKLDFPGEDSVPAFLEKTYNELKEEKIFSDKK